MKVVLRIGGSVIASPPDSVLIGKYVDLLKGLKGEGHEFVVVVGGGSIARDFIELAKEIGLSEQNQDDLAILVSRLFAQLLAMRLGEFGTELVPTSVPQVVQLLNEKKIIVMGGLRPGMTTDTVAAMVAEKIDADLLIKVTDQEGVYTKDPDKHTDAEKIDRLSLDDIWDSLEEDKHKAGIHQILDPEAVRLLQRSKTKTIVANGFKPDNISLAIKGRRIGTLIE
ncbi:MAG: UMP kinase [Candidatus Bathyarchaeota archaeon]|nr:MAG: UMP kinase [Candidatus Bathyarchaeota archaeon]